MSNVLIDRQKIDILANAISDKSGVPVTMTLDEMVEAVDGIETEPNLQAKTYTVDSAGTATVTADSGYDGLSSVAVSVPEGNIAIASDGHFMTIDGTKYFRFSVDAGIDSNNDMGEEGYIPDHTYVSTRDDYLAVPSGTTVTPTESAQTIGGIEYMMQGAVTVNAIPSNYVGSGITQRSSSDLTASGATVTVPSGYYSAQASKAVASGSVGAVSIVTEKTNDKYNVTISHPNATTGYWEQEQINSLNYNTTKSLTLENKSVTPSTTQQVIQPTSREYYLDSVTIAAMPSGTAGTPTATKGTVSNHQVSVTPSVTNTAGYISGGTKTGTAVTVSASELVSGTYTVDSSGTKDVTNYASASVPAGTAGTPSASKGAVSNHSVSVTPSVTNTTGWITGSTKSGTAVTVTASELASGNKAITSNGTGIDVVGYSTVSVDVQGGSSTLINKYITSNGRYNAQDDDADGYSRVDVAVPQLNKVGVSGTGNINNCYIEYDGTKYYAVDEYDFFDVPNFAILTIHYSGTIYLNGEVFANSGTYDDAYFEVVSKDVEIELHYGNSQRTVDIWTQTIPYDVQEITVNGTYNTYECKEVVVNVGGGSSMQIGNLEGYATSSSISFTGLQGEPTAFSFMIDASVSTGTPSKIVAVVFDGTSLHAQTITNTTNAQVTYDSTSLSKTYSNGTLTITSNGPSFVLDIYYGVYVYDGGAVETKDVQVGSGATSITFTGLEDEPAWWSCIFKSNFSTSSGYQRVIYVAKGSTTTNVSGLEMDSEAHNNSLHWTASYNNGSFTITSQGTNAGGYFHQPGYYQLTYAYDDGSSGNYQSKTVTPTTSQQVVEADTGYDALKKVTVNAIPNTYVQPTSTVGATTYRASTSAQTIASGTYHSAQATIAAVTQTNLTAENIKSGTTISISNGQSNLWSVTGSYTGGGGSVNIGTKTATGSSSYTSSLQFTSLSGTPKAFFVRLTTQISRSSNNRYYYVENMRWDGSSNGGVAGRCFYQYSGQLTNITSGYSYSYSSGTLTITSSAASRSASPGAFYNGTYELVYIY